MNGIHDVVADAKPVTEAELRQWGEAFGRGLAAPAAVALRGELGAGKTTLAQAICRGYGVTEDVTSPTYAIVHEYRAERSPVYHLDLYRLDGIRDLQNIGWDDLASARALLIVEWPERAKGRLPDRLVTIDLAADPSRPDRRVMRTSGAA